MSTLRVAWYSIVNGANDYWSIFTLKSWVFGWVIRVVSQVTFFALIGKLLRSEVQTDFLLVGNAVMVAGMGATFALHQPTNERGNGTLPLLLASPSRPVIVMLARGLYVVADAIWSALLGLAIVGPAFGLHFPWPRALLVIPLTMLVGVAAYCFSTFLAGVIIAHRNVNNLVVNTTIVGLMALCGVNVPVSFFPTWLEWIARCLPITDGLEAIRGVLAGDAWSSIGAHVGGELLSASGWLALALLTFGRFIRAGQRDGSLEFAS